MFAAVHEFGCGPKPPPRDPLLDHIIGLCKQGLDLVTGGGAQ